MARPILAWRAAKKNMTSWVLGGKYQDILKTKLNTLTDPIKTLFANLMVSKICFYDFSECFTCHIQKLGISINRLRSTH